MALLVLVASYFAAVRLGAQTKLRILALDVLKTAKRIFGMLDFRYYAFPDGSSAQGEVSPRLWPNRLGPTNTAEFVPELPNRRNLTDHEPCVYLTSQEFIQHLRPIFLWWFQLPV